MNKTGLVAIGLILLLLANAYAYDDGDFQVWNTDVEEIQLKKDLKLAFEQEFRWGDNASEFYYQHYDVGLTYNLNKYWSAGGGYRHVLNKSKDKFLVENEPYVTATFASQFAGFKYDDRSRLEYNHFDYKDDTWRYRNKLTVKAPWKFTKLEIQPFAADEIFILFDDGQRLSENRTTAGLAMNIAKNLKGEVYYMFRTVKSGLKWTDTNVLGTKLKLVF
ncbi:MAG: DUF2490 domain-containing protein [Candidatus Omnitrophica bacterium]|nr:DUF2490 domain-containing protein [Candidatus Omnitrophota bacterium]